ncbi:Ribosomal silencing factor RsfS [Austwickia sp. TVS 96-490-7B]|uniref:ribosome silencing factor n=1 Tax=Austwickia sp. TVS 96-490-7B TaxID=2830843 RepID=UPI001C59E2A1|nr:ribosome silencing factor [Austwickia sp. TVS 96-490-7B]MBW3084432.1 Ribosomal silencing factor RsfS [Austwickia sp. TVS 96-490-7B]
MPATDHACHLAQIAATAAEDKLATDIVALDVSEHLALTDIFLVASAPNERQISSIVDEIEEKLHGAGVKRVRREGDREARWVLIDFGDLVVHVQHQEERTFYQLERLWRDCPAVPLTLGPQDPPADSPR